MQWTQEITDAAVKLWHSGKSAQDVAHEINCQFGCSITKNSWIGKVHRLVALGATSHRADYKPVARDLKLSAKNITGKKLRLPKVKLADRASLTSRGNVLNLRSPSKLLRKSRMVTIDKATGCLYAVTSTSKGIHLFCNKTKSGQSQYCQEHHDLCHTKSTLPVKKILYFIR